MFLFVMFIGKRALSFFLVTPYQLSFPSSLHSSFHPGLLFVTILGLIIWIWRTLVCQTGAGFINQYLKKAKLLESEDAAKHFDSFCEEYLRRDGIFVLQLMEVNALGSVA